MQASCSICGDIFTGIDTEVIHSTPCGHIFHYPCLLEWLRRVPTCPHCRARVDERKTIKLFFHKNDYPVEDSATLCHQVQSLQFQLKMKEHDLKKANDEADLAKSQAKLLRTSIIEKDNAIRSHTTVIDNYQEQIKSLKTQMKRLSDAQLQVEELEKQLKQYENLEKILHGSATDASDALTILKDGSDPSMLCACISTLKKELSQHKEKYMKLQRILRSEEMKSSNATAKIVGLEKKISMLQRSLSQVIEDLSHTEKENENLKKKCQHLEEAIIPPDSESKSSNSRDKALKRFINECPTPSIKKSSTSSIDLETTSALDSSSNAMETGASPISPVRLHEVKQRSMLNNKRFLSSKRTDTPEIQCYDGLGGHTTEKFTRTDRSVLLSMKNNAVKHIPTPPKKFKVTTTTRKPQSNLLSFVKKM